MGLTIGNYIGIGKNSGISWSQYWSRQPEVLFFGLYSEIADGKMPNKVTGATDYLTVAGSAGSETYQAPHTAAYEAADTDYIWFKPDSSQRTTTTAELIGYDFTRTIVYYGDTAPNAIVAIMILNSDVSTAKLQTEFHLPVYWTGVWSDYGYIKSNRPLPQKYTWTPESIYSTEYLAVYNALTTKPSDLIAAAQDTFVSAIVTAGTWAKLDCLYVFAQTTNGASEALVNWKNPGTHNGQLVNSPTFAALEGFTAATNKYITTDFIPTVGTNKFKTQDCSYGYYSRTNVSENNAYDMGARTASTYVEIMCLTSSGGIFFGRMNNLGAISGAIPGGNQTACMIIFTQTGSNAILYRNKNNIGSSGSYAAGSLPNKAFYMLANNNNDTGVLAGSTKQYSMMFWGGGLTSGDVDALTDSFEAYMDSNGKGVIA